MVLRNKTTQKQLEELQLIQCSLLPDEHLAFIDDFSAWEQALETYPSDGTNSIELNSSAHFSVRLDGAKIWFQVTFADEQAEDDTGHEEAKPMPFVSVKGENISRPQQERWHSVIAEKMTDISDSDFPMYQLITLHLLPLLHEELDSGNLQTEDIPTGNTDGPDHVKETFHVLFTSHHLISPHKRRSLQQWSSSLSLTGFAKVGYPGVIYAQGNHANIEEFVQNVKEMQWLALKVRFVEPVPNTAQNPAELPLADGQPRWKEFQKVGKVVEEMRRIGREEYVVEMGIGSAGTK